MSDQRRELASDPVVTRFKGINRFMNIAAVPPDHALDLSNIICSLSGGLRQLRQPQTIHDGGVPYAFTGTCYGIFDFQQPNGTRQIVCIFDTKIYYIPPSGAGWGAAVLVDTNVNNAHFWSAVESENILFMANGYRMLKWTGTNLWQWGAVEPAHIPVLVSINPGGNITLSTGRKYRAALYNSVTNTLGTASEPSLSTGPCDNSSITMSIDVTAEAAADPQYDKVRWYTTFDDGVEYYLLGDVAINRVGPTQYVDNLPDPDTGGFNENVTATELSNPSFQQPDTSGFWEYIVFGQSQWRTVGPNPAIGDLPWVYAHNFGFNIPAGSTIVGVVAQVQIQSQSATTSYVHQVQLYTAGAKSGTPKVPGTTAIPTAVTTDAFGANNDLWGINLTPAKVNDPGFGFGIQVMYAQNGAGQRIFLYSFSITVYYQDAQATTDALQVLTQAQLINDPPLVGKYLALWGGRIYIAGLAAAEQDVIYSGYEKILDGRPEEAFPPGNRLRLGIGADWIRGMGVVQSGLVIGSKSNEMFMFRGEVEDIVTGDPIAFSEVMETLPFKTGFASHYSNVATPDGMVFLSAARTIDGYSGVGRPETMSLSIMDLLRDIATGSEERCQGVFYNYLDKDWYLLGIPSTGASGGVSVLARHTVGTDTFTQANGPLSANWAGGQDAPGDHTVDTVAVSGDIAVFIGSSLFGGAMWNTAINIDQWVEATYARGANSGAVVNVHNGDTKLGSMGFAFSPDEKTLYYVHDAGAGTHQLVKVDWTTGVEAARVNLPFQFYSAGSMVVDSDGYLYILLGSPTNYEILYKYDAATLAIVTSVGAISPFVGDFPAYKDLTLVDKAGHKWLLLVGYQGQLTWVDRAAMTVINSNRLDAGFIVGGNISYDFKCTTDINGDVWIRGMLSPNDDTLWHLVLNVGNTYVLTNRTMTGYGQNPAFIYDRFDHTLIFGNGYGTRKWDINTATTIATSGNPTADCRMRNVSSDEMFSSDGKLFNARTLALVFTFDVPGYTVTPTQSHVCEDSAWSGATQSLATWVVTEGLWKLYMSNTVLSLADRMDLILRTTSANTVDSIHWEPLLMLSVRPGGYWWVTMKDDGSGKYGVMIDANGFGQLGNGGVTPHPLPGDGNLHVGDSMRLEAQGRALRVYYNTTLVWSGTLGGALSLTPVAVGSSYYAGMALWNNAGLDNFSCGDWQAQNVTQLNKIVVIDLDSNANASEGIFLFDIGNFDVISMVENPVTGHPSIIVAQGGDLLEMKPVASGTSDAPVTAVGDPAVLAAYWRSGYFGSSPIAYLTAYYGAAQAIKIWRNAYVIASQDGVVSVEIWLVDDHGNTYEAPIVIAKTAAQVGIGAKGKVTINKRARRAGIKVILPAGADETTVHELWMSRMTVAER